MSGNTYFTDGNSTALLNDVEIRWWVSKPEMHNSERIGDGKQCICSVNREVEGSKN